MSYQIDAPDFDKLTEAFGKEIALKVVQLDIAFKIKKLKLRHIKTEGLLAKEVLEKLGFAKDYNIYSYWEAFNDYRISRSIGTGLGGHIFIDDIKHYFKNAH